MEDEGCEDAHIETFVRSNGKISQPWPIVQIW